MSPVTNGCVSNAGCVAGWTVTPGFAKTLLELDPESDAKVAAALDAAPAGERSKLQEPDTNWDHLQADALVALITGARTADGTIYHHGTTANRAPPRTRPRAA